MHQDVTRIFLVSVLLPILFLSCKKETLDNLKYKGNVERTYQETVYHDTINQVVIVTLNHLNKKVEKPKDNLSISFILSGYSSPVTADFVYEDGNSDKASYIMSGDYKSSGELTIYHNPERLEFNLIYSSHTGGTHYYFSGNKM